MGNSAKRDIRAAERAERQRKALELRKARLSYEQIAKALGYSDKSNARKDVRAAILEIIEEPAKEVLLLELATLDAMQAGLWNKAKSGDGAAVDRVLRIQERRTAYLGLDTPKALTVELNRNLEAMLGRARTVLNDEQFELLLAALGGDHRPPDAGGAKGAEEPAEDPGGDEPGGS